MQRAVVLFAFVLAVAGCSSSSTPGTTPPAADASTDSGDGTGADGGGAGPDTWTSFGESFTKTYCVECHAASDPVGRDYTHYARVAAERDEIRCGVAVSQDPSWGCKTFPPAKQFPIDDGKTPPNPKPSDAERARFVAWLGAGAPE